MKLRKTKTPIGPQAKEIIFLSSCGTGNKYKRGNTVTEVAKTTRQNLIILKIIKTS